MARGLLRIAVLASLFLICSTFVAAQTARPDPTETLRNLLAMPAPTPAAENSATESEPAKPGPPASFETAKTPADDAPINDLIAYWLSGNGSGERAGPSEAVVRRLLEVCTDEPQKLQSLLAVLRPSEETAAKVKAIYEKGLANPQLDEYWHDSVKEWLVFNSKYFLGELLTQANKVKDDEKNGSVDHEEALTALARVDWPSAKPLLKRLSGGPRRAGTLALVLLYKQAISEKDADSEEQYRGRLRDIASDRNAPAKARDTAIDALSETQWSGRDDWYLSLFEDETLILLRDGNYGFSPLGTIFYSDPDKWIPVMAKLVESKNRSIQQAAASCLVRFTNSRSLKPRRDAILPVLRWLSDPDWLEIGSTERAWFMQKMDELEIPESVPGLIWIVENEESNQMWAARTLAHYKDPRAVPGLRKALLSARGHGINYIIEGLVASGGVSETEQVAALEAYAAVLANDRDDLDHHHHRRSDDPSVLVSIGMYLAGQNEVPESVVRAVLARAERLRRTNLQVANKLLEIAHQWQGRQIDLDMIHRIADGSADAATVAKALERRSRLRESVGAEVQSLTAGSDLAQGVAPALLEDVGMAQSVLTSGGETSQIALLVCARLTRAALPLEPVGGLMKSKNQLLAIAVERYLLADDREESRALLWQHHPNEAFITGWRENTHGDNLKYMGKREGQLRAELFEENAPVEIFALISDSYAFGAVLRIYSDKAIYTRTEDPARYRKAVVADAELSAFKQFVATNLMNLGPQFGGCHYDCWTSEFLSLTKEKGRRVFSQQGFRAWSAVLENFDLLGRREGAKIHYNLEKEIKGLEVLYADESTLVKDIGQQGGEIRVFVERQATQDELDEKKKMDSSRDDEDEATRLEFRRREAALARARFSWRAFAGNKLGAVASAPDGYKTFDESKFPQDDLDESSSHRRSGDAQVISPDSIVFTRNFEGLWRQTAGRNAVRISGEDGAYSGPVVTPDGKWVVAAKTDSDWGVPNFVVRFNLQTGREYRVNLAPADQFDVVVYLPLQGKVLLRRAKDSEGSSSKSAGPESPEYYLLDAATGLTQKVSGEFAPLLEESRRFLQATRAPAEFWAAIPNRDQDQTQVGRYNLKDFSFQPVLRLPHIAFESMSMWVDEQAGKLYVVYQGHLLRLPLTDPKPSTDKGSTN